MLSLSLGAALALTLVGVADGARADSRGACVEVSATSAPTSAPLALDEERAAWVGGTFLLARAEHGVPGGRRGGSPAWCELGDEAQCDPGSAPPSPTDSATYTDAGVVCGVAPERPLSVHEPRVQHPPIRVAGEAEGTRTQLERPPRQA